MASGTTTIDVRVRTAPDDATCATCRWWMDASLLIPAFGCCRKRAPVRVPIGEYQWPSTPADYLCGEWEAKL
jgi:hypothetical protein